MTYQETKLGTIISSSEKKYTVLLPDENPQQTLTDVTSIYPDELHPDGFNVMVGFPEIGNPEIASHGIICSQTLVNWPQYQRDFRRSGAASSELTLGDDYKYPPIEPGGYTIRAGSIDGSDVVVQLTKMEEWVPNKIRVYCYNGNTGAQNWYFDLDYSEYLPASYSMAPGATMTRYGESKIGQSGFIYYSLISWYPWWNYIAYTGTLRGTYPSGASVSLQEIIPQDPNIGAGFIIYGPPDTVVHVSYVVQFINNGQTFYFNPYCQTTIIDCVINKDIMYVISYLRIGFSVTGGGGIPGGGTDSELVLSVIGIDLNTGEEVRRATYSVAATQLAGDYTRYYIGGSGSYVFNMWDTNQVFIKDTPVVLRDDKIFVHLKYSLKGINVSNQFPWKNEHCNHLIEIDISGSNITFDESKDVSVITLLVNEYGTHDQCQFYSGPVYCTAATQNLILSTSNYLDDNISKPTLIAFNSNLTQEWIKYYDTDIKLNGLVTYFNPITKEELIYLSFYDDTSGTIQCFNTIGELQWDKTDLPRECKLAVYDFGSYPVLIAASPAQIYSICPDLPLDGSVNWSISQTQYTFYEIAITKDILLVAYDGAKCFTKSGSYVKEYTNIKVSNKNSFAFSRYGYFTHTYIPDNLYTL
jgi:hypothetical protein